MYAPRHFPVALLMLAALLCLGACNDDDPLEPYYSATIPNLRDVKYGDAEKQNLDIFLPGDSICADTLHPVIIYIHGGAWTGGDKSDWAESAIDAFRALDYLSVSVNYRLVPSAFYPDCLLDVINAIDWVHRNIAAYGGDPHDLTLVGHSAGSHMVASVVCNQKYLQGTEIDCHDFHLACLLDGGGYLAMDEAIYDDESIYDMVVTVLNGHNEYWTDFGPANSIEDCDYLPPFLLCHSDAEYRIKSNAELRQRLQDFGHQVDEYTMAGYTHGNMLGYFPYYRDEYDVISHFLR